MLWEVERKVLFVHLTMYRAAMALSSQSGPYPSGGVTGLMWPHLLSVPQYETITLSGNSARPI